MAASDAIPVPRKNAAYRFYFAIRKPSDSTLITTWTGMDSEVSLDGAAFADCTAEATEIGTSGCGFIDLTAAEMNADAVVLKVTVTNTGAVPLVFTLLPESAGDYRVSDTQKVDVETIKTQVVTCAAGVTVLASVGTAATSTAQTGDTFALANGVAGFVAIDTVVNAILLDTGTDGVVVAAASKTGYTLTATTGLGNQTANITGTITTTTSLTNLPTITPDWITAAGLAADAVAEIQSGLALAETALSTAVWTNTLATNLGTTNSDWANGGRLDLILDIIAADTTTDIPALIAPLATAANLLLVDDIVSYCLTILCGACSDAGTSAETYVRALNGETFTVDFTGLDATGNRTATTLSKV